MTLVSAFFIALFIALIFTPVRKNSVTPLAVFFFVLFLAAIATPYWIIPFGPIVKGVALLPMVAIVLFFALLLSAPPPGYLAKQQNEKQEDVGIAAVSIFVWILFCLLIVAIITGSMGNKPM